MLELSNRAQCTPASAFPAAVPQLPDFKRNFKLPNANFAHMKTPHVDTNWLIGILDVVKSKDNFTYVF